jgi:2-hydroxychromene-2-carboxylate isomerase
MKIEFYFDFSCPFAYIASTRIEALCAAEGAELCWRPMLLGVVFRGTGAQNSPMEKMGPAKARHTELDMHRWAAAFGLPVRKPDAHPIRTVRALRALLALPETDWPPVIHEIYRAYWQRGDDINSADILRAVLERAGVRGHALDRAVAANDDPAIKDALRQRTDEAVGRGVFGAPTTFVHVQGRDQPLMFWGQDRLHMVRAALRGWRPDGMARLQAGARIAQLDPAPGTANQGRGSATLHFWYDFSSPFACLAANRIAAVAERAGARLRWRPMLLGALFKEIATASVPLFAMTEVRRAYMIRDLDRWASYWNLPFTFASRFPQNTVTALRLALLAGERIAELSLAFFNVMWAQGGNLEDPGTLARVLREHGFDADAMLARTREPEVKQALFDSTAEAVAAGVFGAPTCVVEDEHGDRRGDLVFWGQDRLELVEAALRGWRAGPADTDS